MNITLLIISSIAIIGVSLIGKLATLGSFEKYIQKHMSLFASFSAGIFAVVIFSGIRESSHTIGIGYALIAALVGFILVTLVSIFVPESHHHHNNDSHTHSKKGVWKILTSDALHNVVDGIALVLAFSVSSELGIVMAVSIFAHEFVQELGEYFALRSYGLNQIQALWRNFLVACTLVVGVVIGLLISNSGIVEPWVLAISAGTFISVLVFDMIPHNVRTAKAIAVHILYALIGAGLLFAITLATPHSHDHNDHDHSEEIAHNHNYETVAQDHLDIEEVSHVHETADHVH
jgi:zinc transporter ZupT